MDTLMSKVSAGIEKSTAAIGSVIDDIQYAPSQSQINHQISDRYRDREIETSLTFYIIILL